MRLTNATRSAMADKAVARLNLKDKLEDVIEDYIHFVEFCRKEINEADDYEIDAAINEMKTELGERLVYDPVYRADSFYVYFDDGSRIHLNINGYHRDFTQLAENIGIELRYFKEMPAKYIVSAHRYSGFQDGCKTLSTTYLEKYELLKLEIEALFNKISEAKTAVFSVTSNIKTVKKLLEVWPEAVHLLPEEEVPEKVNYPALQISMINNILNLGEA